MKKGYFICMKRLLWLLLSIFLFSMKVHAVSDLNSSGPSHVDSLHKAVSSKVHKWAVDIDEMLMDVYDYFGENNTSQVYESNDILFKDANESIVETVDMNVSIVDHNDTELEFFEADEEETASLTLSEKLQEDNISTTVQSFDAFFLTRRELEERDKSYVRVRFSQLFNSLSSEKTRAEVRAKLHLGRSKKKLKLVIEDLNDDTAQNIGRSDNKESPSIGVERSSGKVLGIKPKYSIGFRGIDPYVRARYYYETELGLGWKFHPVQTFLYTLEEEFSELTEFYFDKPTSENTMFRFVADRGTEDRVDGMRYDTYLQWFYTPRDHAGLSFTLGANAHTKYQNTIIDSDPPLIHEENRVYNYSVYVRWRENIWKKWLFYEITPGVNYHEENDYRPNYNILFRVELFFGRV